MTEQKRLFFKRQSILGNTFKSFRKSQDAKAQWRQNLFTQKRAVSSWHDSMEGRRYHRKLAIFNITHERKWYSLFSY